MADKQQQEDENNPLQAEILREVAEEMKEEQIKKLWKKISPVVTAAIVAILVATGFIQYTAHRNEQQALKDSADLSAALTLVDEGRREEALEKLRSLRDSDNGYRDLAAMHYVDLQIEDGNIDEAIKGLDAIAADKRTPQALRSLAMLHKVSIAIDGENPDYDALSADLAKLVEAENAWTADALELSALIALRQGKYDLAKTDFQQILSLQKVPELKRMRATENLNLLNKKMESEETK